MDHPRICCVLVARLLDRWLCIGNRIEPVHATIRYSLFCGLYMCSPMDNAKRAFPKKYRRISSGAIAMGSSAKVVLVMTSVILVNLYASLHCLRATSLTAESTPLARGGATGNHFYTNDSSNKSLASPSPRIAFLFLTSRKPNEDVWKQWFPEEDDRFSIFVHTAASNTTVPLDPFFCSYAIPSIPSEWYFLHDMMMHVLQYARDHDPDAVQFMFVGDTSIPLVSFDTLYNRLMDDEGKSRVCWSEHYDAVRTWEHQVDELTVDMDVVQKAELWSSLSRPHVDHILGQEEVMEEWNRVFVANRKKFSDDVSVGAPDENFFPTQLHMFASQYQELPQFYNCSSGLDKKVYPHEQCCTTSIIWQEWQGDVFVGRTRSLLSNSCNPMWPCTFQTLHEDGLVALQQEGYLFLRKVLRQARVITNSNETIPLWRALPHLHNGKNMEASITEPSAKPQNFECVAPQFK